MAPIVHGQSNKNPKTSSPATAKSLEPISITMDDIRENALPKLRQEKLQMKQVAEHINGVADDAVRDSMDYAIVYEQYMQNLRSLQSHNCYKDEKTVAIPPILIPSPRALAELAAERARLAKEREEKEHKEKMLALQKEQKEKQETIIKQQQMQIVGQREQLLVADKQIRETQALRAEIEVRNQQLNQQMQLLNSHAANRNSLLYQQNQEIEKVNRYVRYGF